MLVLHQIMAEPVFVRWNCSTKLQKTSVPVPEPLVTAALNVSGVPDDDTESECVVSEMMPVVEAAMDALRFPFAPFFLDVNVVDDDPREFETIFA
jgi:hypothetical protein